MEMTPELCEKLIKTSFLSCKDIHDHTCLISALQRLLLNFKNAAKIFIPLYFVPTLIMKRKQLKSSGGMILKQTLKTCLRTLGFVSAWFAIWKYALCSTKNLRMTVDGWNAIISGFLSGLAILFESEEKASQITLLMIPRVLETFWNLLRKRINLQHELVLGQILVYGLTLGVLNYFYQNEQESINPSYLKIFKKIWGIN